MGKFGVKKRASIAIDLGNNNTILTDKIDHSFSHPSFVALSELNRSVRAAGNEAYAMFGKAPESLKVIKPLKGGVIADFDSASKMLSSFIYSAYPKKMLFGGFDQIIAGVPFSTTEVERRALRDALGQFNSSKQFLLFEPLAAAIGMGVDIKEPDGKFVVDIGGGITEAVVISLSGVVNYNSVRIAGDAFDEEIQNYFKRNLNVDVTLKMAEKLKIEAGAAIEMPEKNEGACYIVGKDLGTGIPKKILIKPAEIAHILDGPLGKIEQAILKTLEECPPELSGDIYGNGLYLTGGSSLLRGLKERLETRLKIPVHHDPDALLSVTKGLAKVLQNTKAFRPVLVD